MTERLRVWLSDRPVGTLERDDAAGMQFLPDGPADALSVAAPRGGGAWSLDLTRAWFDGLLPEGTRRERIEARFGLREGDTFGLLAEIGWECAGAVAVMAEDRSPSDGRLEPASEAAIGEHLDALPELLPGRDDELRMSLGGAQDKLLLAGAPRAWAFPLDGAPSTFILKPEPDRWPGLAAAEAWSLRLAGAATTASEATLLDGPGRRPVLAVRRYDRRVEGPVVQRLHQEDLCQALGLPSSRKYAAPNAAGTVPSFAGLAAIILERAADPPNELERLLQQATVAVALRNADLHGKNLSLLNEDGTVHLSPVYDVAPTTAFVPAQQRLGLSVGGAFRLGDIGGDHLVREAKMWGLPERIARDIVATTVETLHAGLVEADARVPDVSQPTRAIAVAGIFAVSVDRPGRPPSRTAARSTWPCLGRSTAAERRRAGLNPNTRIETTIRKRGGGDEGTRTPDPCDANAVLSQLSYIPTRPRRASCADQPRKYTEGRPSPARTARAARVTRG